MSSMGALLFLLAPSLFGLFCPYPEQQPVVEAGVPVLRLVAFDMPPLASCIIDSVATVGFREVEPFGAAEKWFTMVLILVGVGAYFAWKMLKGDGGCCGWGGDNTDPWSSHTRPVEGTPAA